MVHLSVCGCLGKSTIAANCLVSATLRKVHVMYFRATTRRSEENTYCFAATFLPFMFPCNIVLGGKEKEYGTSDG